MNKKGVKNLAESNNIKGKEHTKSLKPGCLEGVTILDFTWVLAGPHASKLLTDLGATVIKVEQYKTGSTERQYALQVSPNGVVQSSYSINVNRGKKSICVNLKSPKGMDIIRELIAKSDAIIENFGMGVMDRLELDYESAKKIKEDIIYCSITCFGHWGPYSHKPGYDMIAQAASGWTTQSEYPQIAPVSIGDTVAGIHAALAIVSALYTKQAKGIGQNIDISMQDCLFTLHENSIPWYNTGQAVGESVHMDKIGRLHPGYAPYGIFKGKDGLLSIANIAESRWAPMVKVMGEKYNWLLSDSRTNTLANRCRNTTLINEIVEEWIMSFDSVKEVERILEQAGVPCMRARSVEELADNDPHIAIREMMPIVEQPFIGPMKMIGSPLKLSETPSCIRGYSPFIGEHNNKVLGELLKYSEEQVKTLYDEDILYHEPAVERL